MIDLIVVEQAVKKEFSFDLSFSFYLFTHFFTILGGYCPNNLSESCPYLSFSTSFSFPCFLPLFLLWILNTFLAHFFCHVVSFINIISKITGFVKRK